MYFCYDDIYRIDNIYSAYLKARKGKGEKRQTLEFENNTLRSVFFLQDLLKNEKYEISEYNVFYVYEPKQRLIMSNRFVDKVVQHTLCDNIIEPIFKPKLIYDNCANQKGKGVHFGLDRTEKHLRKFYNKYGRDGYILQCDISEYFYSISHDILKSLVYPYLPDGATIRLVEMIIDSLDGGIGLPMGNLTSQWFAIIYIDVINQFIKRELKIKHYVNYVDDFILIHHDKKYLQHCKKEIDNFLMDKLKLKLNPKTDIFPIKNGVDFLGFHIYITPTGKIVKKLRRKSKVNVRRKLRKGVDKIYDGEINFDHVYQSYMSWRGHAKHGNCHYLIRDMDWYFYSLYKDFLRESLTKEEFIKWQKLKI